MTIQSLLNAAKTGNVIYSHTGSRRGYESRKGDGRVEQYKGKFGEGFAWIKPRFDTTRYVDVAYYINK